MQNYNDLVVNTLIETSTTNVLKVVNYDKITKQKKLKSLLLIYVMLQKMFI